MTEDTVPLIAPAPLFWRLPIIRHVRTIWRAWRVARWEQNRRSMGMIPRRDFDDRVLRQIWRGIV